MATDSATRQHICRLLLEEGECTAAKLSRKLNITTNGVRRHLDKLLLDGVLEAVDMPVSANKDRGRGRPAKQFRLTPKGRQAFGHDYDQLAYEALDALQNLGGTHAVESLAEQRMRRILGSSRAHSPCAQSVSIEEDPSLHPDEELHARIKDITETLNAHGYVTTIEEGRDGVEICRHHCPIQTAAHEFPELCVAEHRVLTEFLGHHAQPLATIAAGHGVCTTYIPLRTRGSTIKGTDAHALYPQQE